MRNLSIFLIVSLTLLWFLSLPTLAWTKSGEPKEPYSGSVIAFSNGTLAANFDQNYGKVLVRLEIMEKLVVLEIMEKLVRFEIRFVPILREVLPNSVLTAKKWEKNKWTDADFWFLKYLKEDTAFFKNERLEFAIGKKIRAKMEDRQKEKEWTPGLKDKGKYVAVNVGWRLHKKFWWHDDFFDGLASARGFFTLTQGKLVPEVQVENLEVDWNKSRGFTILTFVPICGQFFSSLKDHFIDRNKKKWQEDAQKEIEKILQKEIVKIVNKIFDETIYTLDVIQGALKSLPPDILGILSKILPKIEIDEVIKVIDKAIKKLKEIQGKLKCLRELRECYPTIYPTILETEIEELIDLSIKGTSIVLEVPID